jgi:putative DNA primase/helicase
MSKIINIATGLSVFAKVWKNKKISWEDFTARIENVHRTTETLKEYLAASKEDRSKIKDSGGYVGGYLRNGKRTPKNVVSRQLVTLDLDFAHFDIWNDFTMSFDNAAILHSTHSHTKENPRFRLIIPLEREVSPDEYLAISRKIAGLVGIDFFDNTTFQTQRLMFWPSCSKDAEYYCKIQKGQWVNPDGILAMYDDWRDTSLWPTSKQLKDTINHAAEQEDPEAKKGIVGIFCRTYGITDVLETFLSDLYKEGMGGRYTYVNGSTSSGLVIYDDKFSYSHHNTDPTADRLCNAFDLVRLHKFGHLEEKKSFSEMEQFALSQKEIKEQIAKETLENSKYDFSDKLDDLEEPEEENTDWMLELESDARGNYLSSAINIDLILRNDIRLKNKFRYNEFNAKRYVTSSLPWRKVLEIEPLKNVDYSGLRNYIEAVYGIVSNLKIEDSLAIEYERQSFHPIREYLNSLSWDGCKRLDTLLIDYFGAKDSIYTREAIRVPLVGAVARVFCPGIKFDLVLTLVSEQGTFKSTFLKKLGKEWFSDTFMTVNGKEAFEQVQGAWIIEMAELSGLRKAEVEAVKHFITKQEDVFRPAYARTSEVFKRQCVFFGTTNVKDFLRDPSGNRRFLPIDVVPDAIKKSVIKDLTDFEVDQIWAEAVNLFKNSQPLYLSPQADILAKFEQASHSEIDDRQGLILNYLDMRLPKNWAKLSLEERRLYINGGDYSGEFRDYVCIAEIWTECLGKHREDMTRYNTRDVNDIMRSLNEWEAHSSTRNFSLYGKQKYYSRKLN